jgi:single-strand DNA-binding protein
MNVFTFTGNLGRDAEQRYTPSGDSVVTFSVPVKSGFGDKAITSWIKCTLWGKCGDSVLPYLKKGQLVGVSGEFQCREYQDKDGQQRYSNEVRVNDVNLLGKRGESNDENAQAPQRNAQGAPPQSKAYDGLSDDIPFAQRAARGPISHVL